jgi:polyhydroxybutyrate depolymerase
MTQSARPLLLCATLSLAWGAGCGDDGGTTGSGGGASTSSTGGAGTGTGGATGVGGMTTTDFVAGGDRPVTVRVPDGYDPGTPAPLLILLHGYTATGAIQNEYFGLEPVALENGFVYAYPDGTVDPQGNQFWSATDACCDGFGSGVDDASYLIGLVDEIETRVNVDPKRVYFAGHSNGGFMSYRMACDYPDRIAAIVSLAGAMFLDDGDCKATTPVSVLQIHGTADATVPYDGGDLYPGATVPGAVTTVADWAARNGCDPTATDTGTTLDLDSVLAGEETTDAKHAGCTPGYDAELMTIAGGAHVPTLTPAFSETLVAFLLAHPKP